MARFSEWEIREILRQVAARPSSELESERVEFKAYKSEQALHNSKDLAEELSALANKGGGGVIVGVKDESDVPGSNWPAQLAGMEEVDVLETKERLSGKLRPLSVDVSVRNISFESKNFVMIEVAHLRDSLVSTTSGKTCIRDGRSSRPMSPDEIEKAVKALVTYDWSADPLDLSPSESLDNEAVQQALVDFCTRRDVDDTPDHMSFLEAVGATRDGVLLRGGLLFLGKTDVIRRELGDHEYRFSWKKPNGELVVNDVWSGCVWAAIGRAKHHFDECNRIQQFTYKDKSFSAPLLDATAFHEAYLNALVHRDYSTEGMVSVSFTGDRMVITSPGTFYGGVRAENIALHEPRHRNKVLARILMTHHLVDRAGMGVLRMGIGSLRYGRSFPQFREAPDAVEVSMEAEYLKPAIAVLALENLDSYGIPELLILNAVHGAGTVVVNELERQLVRLVGTPWPAIVRSVAVVSSMATPLTPTFVRSSGTRTAHRRAGFSRMRSTSGGPGAAAALAGP
jgi:predicted HTH transcriptional regulator